MSLRNSFFICLYYTLEEGNLFRRRKIMDNREGEKSMIKGIIFDLDGTLLNTAEDLDVYCRDAAEKEVSWIK